MIPVAVLDACVLYPPALRDLLMRLASGLRFAPRFTDAIHEKWIRNVLLDHSDVTRPQLERTRALMNAIDSESLIIGYEHRIAGLVLPDPDDRHVLAAALEAAAPTIVTFNRRDFPKATLKPLGVVAQPPDDFVCGLFEADPPAVIARVARQRESLKRPPRTASEMVETFRRNKLTKFAARLENHLGDL